MLTYIVLYCLIGILISIVSWFIYTSCYTNRTNEGDILLYLITCVVLWPAAVVGLFIDLGKAILK